MKINNKNKKIRGFLLLLATSFEKDSSIFYFVVDIIFIKFYYCATLVVLIYPFLPFPLVVFFIIIIILLHHISLFFFSSSSSFSFFSYSFLFRLLAEDIPEPPPHRNQYGSSRDNEKACAWHSIIPYQSLVYH